MKNENHSRVNYAFLFLYVPSSIPDRVNFEDIKKLFQPCLECGCFWDLELVHSTSKVNTLGTYIVCVPTNYCYLSTYTVFF